jgi:hypothetical protein
MACGDGEMQRSARFDDFAFVISDGDMVQMRAGGNEEGEQHHVSARSG